MSVALSAVPIQDFFIDGVPANGGKLFVYLAGTTTKTTTFTDASGGTAQTNAIIMNSRGEPENTFGASTGVWINPTLGAYKLVFAPSTDTDPPTNPIWTVDNINPVAAATTFFDLSFEFMGGTPPLSNEVMGLYVADRSQRFYANFNGGSVGGVAAFGMVRVNPTATFAMIVYRNASEVIGGISVSTGGVYSFTTVGGVSFDLTAGQYLKIVAPSSTDATFADASWTLPGYDL